VLGAWHHTVDALEDHGAPSMASATVADVVDVVAVRWGPALAGQVDHLGRVVNDTLFDPDGFIEPSAGSTAWSLADAVVAAVRAAPPVAGDPVAEATEAPAGQVTPV